MDLAADPAAFAVDPCDVLLGGLFADDEVVGVGGDVSAVDLARPLEWGDFSKEHEARSLGFAWRIYQAGAIGHWNCVRCAPDHERLATGVSLAAAQAAANADHAARVIAALDADLLAELVGALAKSQAMLRALVAESGRGVEWGEEDGLFRCPLRFA